ncbi:hypothetical protein [Variovorax paradoxus]|uniref:hypothetical protein n=1 Tax=Variovorax paradoxus TaxID=34073 RepID=UPI001933A00E|nr:hypothetical protein INQ48_14045 [Variovorax paradoxus]
MATQLLPDQTGYGVRRPPAAPAPVGTVPPPAAGDVIGRRPTINMGMADVVPPPQIAPSAAGAPVAASSPTGVATQAPAAAPAGELIGRRPAVNMGAAEVVQPTRLPAVASAAAAPAAASGLGLPVARAVGGAGVALGVGLEGKQVYDVATNPNATGLDVAAQTAQGVGRLSAAGAGASGGAAMGSALGPAGSVVGGLIGGGLGYLAADRAIAGGRAALGADPRAPVDRLTVPAPVAAPDPQGGGGAAFGIYPRPSSQFSTNLNDAALQRGVIATGPRSFAPATPVGTGVAAAAPAARLNNLTDPRSLEYQGGATPAAGVVSAAPAAYGEPLADSMAGLGALPPAAAPAAPSGLPLGVTRSGNSFSGTNVGTPTAADPNALGGLADTNARLARLQASNASVPQGALTVIENPGPAAAQSMFDGAALRTLAARGAPPGRNGAQVFAQQVDAALTPLQQRAQAAALATREAGDTQRTLIQERATQARTAAQTAQQQEANAIDRARLGIEAVRASTAGLPAGYRLKADGSGLEFIPGGPADPDTAKGKNALTEGQSKALLFGSRMQTANKILGDLQASGKLFSTPGANTPVVGGLVNLVNSEQGQQLDQAKRDFLNATLRRESGAVISPAEFDNGDKQYFPQPGDSSKVIEQKRQNREVAIRGILAEVPNSEARAATVVGNAGNAAAPATLPAGMSRQVGTSGGKPVYEDAQGRRFIGS